MKTVGLVKDGLRRVRETLLRGGRRNSSEASSSSRSARGLCLRTRGCRLPVLNISRPAIDSSIQPTKLLQPQCFPNRKKLSILLHTNSKTKSPHHSLDSPMCRQRIKKLLRGSLKKGHTFDESRQESASRPQHSQTRSFLLLKQKKLMEYSQPVVIIRPSLVVKRLLKKPSRTAWDMLELLERSSPKG